MTFKKFKEEVVKELEMEAGNNYKVKVEVVTKNNDNKLTSVSLINKENCCAPCVYLENLYNETINDEDIAGVANDILNIVMENQMDAPDFKWIMNWETAKQKVFCKVINTEKNKCLLEVVPHKEFLNLSIAFYVNVVGMASDRHEIKGTSLVKLEHLKMWSIDQDILYNAALENMRGTATIKSMEQIIMEFADKDEFDIDELKDLDENEIGIKMYVLSNKDKIFGAAALLDKEMLSRLEEKFQNGFYILPSSIHELILIPFDKTIEISALNQMVTEVNQNEVAAEEVLSDTVYYYDNNSKEIKIAA